MGDYIEEMLENNELEIEFMDMLDYDPVYGRDEEISEFLSHSSLKDGSLL